MKIIGEFGFVGPRNGGKGLQFHQKERQRQDDDGGAYGQEYSL